MSETHWFKDAAFGAFIHWGLFAVPGGIWKDKETEYIGEWLQARFRIPNAEYSRLAEQFNPVKFDADDWIRQFRDAGMKYIVFTTKHHEGFAMFRTAASPYNIVDATPFGRDPLAELSAACRKYGLRFGIYYSQFLDWHEPDGGDPKYETWNIGHVPWGNDWDFPDKSLKNFERYFRGKVVPQLTELLTNYGPVSVLWCDCPLDMPRKYSVEIRELVHRLQPDCLINSRIGNGCQDYRSLGDNQLPGSAIPGLVECPMTLNDTWGWKVNDHHWKTAATVVGSLLAMAEQKTNLLLNVGPKPDGMFPEATSRILAEIAEWHKANGRAICSTSGNPFPQALEFAYVLLDGRTLHFFPKAGAGRVTLSGIQGTVVSSDVPCAWSGDELQLDFSVVAGCLYPDVAVTFEAAPVISATLMPQNGKLILPASAARITQGQDAGAAGGKASETDVAGQKTSCDAHALLGNNGAITSWQNPSDRIEWTAAFAAPGTYEIRCVTQSGAHSHPWIGDREVEFRLGDAELRTRLSVGTPVGSAYYPGMESVLGTVDIGAKGPAEISLRTLSVSSQDALAMNLVSLKLVKVG